MSLCDVCPRPGRCCTGFHLGPYGDFAQHAETPLDALCEAAKVVQPDVNDRQIVSLPFMPLLRESQSAGDRWRWWCVNLGRDGRCMDYENRPWLCGAYQPGMDKLCAMKTNAVTASMLIPSLPAPA